MINAFLTSEPKQEVPQEETAAATAPAAAAADHHPGHPAADIHSQQCHAGPSHDGKLMLT